MFTAVAQALKPLEGEDKPIIQRLGGNTGYPKKNS